MKNMCFYRIMQRAASSPLAPLFTELGILLLRFGRIILALRYLAYLVSFPNVHYALRHSTDAGTR